MLSAVRHSRLEFKKEFKTKKESSFLYRNRSSVIWRDLGFSPGTIPPFEETIYGSVYCSGDGNALELDERLPTIPLRNNLSEASARIALKNLKDVSIFLKNDGEIPLAIVKIADGRKSTVNKQTELKPKKISPSFQIGGRLLLPTACY